MLPRINRLSRNRIRDVLASGKRLSSPTILWYHMPSDEQVSRFACIVPLRISKYAVKRNRIKRLLRDVFFSLLTVLPRPIDIVVMVKTAVQQKQKMVIQKELFDLASKSV